MLRISVLVMAALCASGTAGAQPLELVDCRISAGPGAPSMKARCGTLQRPLDPNGAVPGDIELRIAVVPALNLTPEPDPVVPIAGGPGQGSVQFYTAYSFAFEDVRRNRDILLIDQRGTGESATMDCEFDDDIIDGEYSTELTLEYTELCLQQLPYDPRFFTTSVAVTDIEAVREALGYPALNLYGVSYGTRVAQHGEHILLAIPHVNNEGQFLLLGKPHVAVEVVLLDRKRRVVPVAIQTRLAQGDHVRTARQFDNPVPIVRRRGCTTVRLDANGCRHVTVSRG